MMAKKKTKIEYIEFGEVKREKFDLSKAKPITHNAKVRRFTVGGYKEVEKKITVKVIDEKQKAKKIKVKVL